MNNFVQPGEVQTFTAPAGGVTAGQALQIGGLLGIVAADAAADAECEVKIRGVFTVPKATGQVWAEGALVYFKDASDHFTTTATNNRLAGWVVAAAASADATGQIYLDGVARTAGS